LPFPWRQAFVIFVCWRSHISFTRNETLPYFYEYHSHFLLHISRKLLTVSCIPASSSQYISHTTGYHKKRHWILKNALKFPQGSGSLELRMFFFIFGTLRHFKSWCTTYITLLCVFKYPQLLIWMADSVKCVCVCACVRLVVVNWAWI
jgi:hypothetical protein